MNNIVNEIKKCKVFYVATIDKDKPRVRPFSSVMDYEDKVYICTNDTKDVYKQLMNNPNIELCGMNNNGEWIRVSGNIVNDDRIEVKKAMLSDPTGPSNIYKYDDPIFKVMYIDNIKCIKYSFNNNPIEIK